MRRAVWILALGGCPVACGAAPPATSPDPGALAASRAVASARPAGRAPAPRGSAPDRHPTPAASRSCKAPADAAAWLDCDGVHVDTNAPIVAHPLAPVPGPATRAVLDAVAALMAAHPGIHLLRIEAYSSLPTRGDPARVRREMGRSQDRADAVFHYLWRTRHVSPERMEAVGLGFVPGHAQQNERWPVELRIVQRAGQR